MDPPFDHTQSLLTELASACCLEQGFGSMSPSIYDTAWLSMVEKPPLSGFWLFPTCFDYILQQQLPSGAWESYSTPVDGILNTCAALLALRKHLLLCPDNEDWISRSRRAEIALGELLCSWDISSSDQIGFEVLIPKHLSLLASEGIKFNLPQLAPLQHLHESKVAKLSSKHIYHAPSTLLHSLEALVGDIDFDRVRSWRENNGSMMGSPSSTAAYLMNATQWDDEAEAYLRTVIEHGVGKGNGSVPCAWPTSVFEVSWVITTFTQASVPIGEAESNTLSTFLEKSLSNRGCVGFAPSSFPDSDDTARALMALMQLRKTVSVETLVKDYESEDHFLTYSGERNPSITSNCNVLACLCMMENPLPYATQIAKAAKFLCSEIYLGNIRDKWHHHKHYWMMLTAQAFEHLYQKLQDSEVLLQTVLEHAPILREQLPFVSLQIVADILASQQPNGSWDSICEPTAYAILALASLAQLPWVHQTLNETSIIPSIEKAKLFLETKGKCQWSNGNHLWVEKVSYASSTLSRAYCEAALSKPVMRSNGLNYSNAPFLLPEKLMRGMQGAGKLIAQTPLFAHLEKSLIRQTELQASYALLKLQQERLNIFPRKAMRKDTYLTFVPLTWTACNALHGSKTSLYVLYEMMVLSMLVYQSDEYIEGVIEKDLGQELGLVRNLIKKVFSEFNYSSENCPNGHNKAEQAFFQNKSLEALSEEKRNALLDADLVLGKFVKSVLKHPAVMSRPVYLQAQLAVELETFLLAHITQAEDNQHLRRSQLNHSNGFHPSKSNPHTNGNSHTPGSHSPPINGANGAANGHSGGASFSPRAYNIKAGRSFYSWVRSTSADHTSGPFAFTFFNCLIGSDNIFATAKTAYVAEDLCRHLSSLCRMYNDYACVIRDTEEGNLNSTHFPEFHGRQGSSDGAHKSSGQDLDEMQRIKDELMWIAEYERKGLNTAMGQLEALIGHDDHGRDLLDALKLFIDVTDLYGLIYLLRDVSPRMK